MDLTERLVKFFRRGTSYRWAAAFAASRLEHGQLNTVAEELAITVRMARDYRAAGKAYKQLRKLGSQLPFYAKTLSVSHFARVGYLLDRGKMQPNEAIEEIRTAAESRCNIANFGTELTNVYENDESNLWRRWIERAFKNALKLRDAFGAPEQLKEAAATFVNEYQLWEQGELEHD